MLGVQQPLALRVAALLIVVRLIVAGWIGPFGQLLGRQPIQRARRPLKVSLSHVQIFHRRAEARMPQQANVHSRF